MMHSRAFLMALVLGAACWLPGSAQAQLTSPGNASGYAPTNTNRQTQPLSPYLNLLRGGNNAVNYFYGVRPGLGSPTGGGMGGTGSSMSRQTFFPIVDNLADLSSDENRGPGIPPTGHPVGFNNTLGYYGGNSTNPAMNAQRRNMMQQPNRR